MADLGSMIPMATLAAFGAADWAVLVGYLVLLVGASLYFTRRGQKTTDDYFLAGRRMPAWAAAMSVMATSISAATFIGGPEESYTGDLTYLSSYLGLIIAAIVVAVFFIPAFYRANVSTVYQLLEIRFGKPAKVVASCMFMLGRVLASGARLYIGAIAGAWMLFGVADVPSICAAIAIITVIGIAYTFIGGIEAVVWTDVIQGFVLIGAAVIAIVVLVNAIPLSGAQMLDALRTPEVLGPSLQGRPVHLEGPSKLTLIKSGIDTQDPMRSFSPANTWGLFSIILAFSLFGIGSYGTDQDLTQRMLTCRNARSAGWSVIGGILVSIPVALLFLVVGLLLYLFYLAGDPAAGDPPASRDVFLLFILNQMPSGVAGLMMAGLFAAALSSLNSELNAMSSTLVNDILRELRPRLGERTYLRAGRVGVVLWGVALGGFAIFCAFWQEAPPSPGTSRGGASDGGKLIKFALGVMMFAYSGLVAVFFTVLFTNRGSTASVMLAFLVGFSTVLGLNWQPWIEWLGWPALNLAFTWKMFIATGLAFVVCVLGSPRDRAAVSCPPCGADSSPAA